MKRLFSLLLAAWCTAFAQVQPEAVVPFEISSCCCGEACVCPDDCGIVATLPVNPSPAERSSASVEVRRLATKSEPALDFSPAPPCHAVKPVHFDWTAGSPPDAVPRFCRHCAFLI